MSDHTGYRTTDTQVLLQKKLHNLQKMLRHQGKLINNVYS